MTSSDTEVVFNSLNMKDGSLVQFSKLNLFRKILIEVLLQRLLEIKSDQVTTRQQITTFEQIHNFIYITLSIVSSILLFSLNLIISESIISLTSSLITNSVKALYRTKASPSQLPESYYDEINKALQIMFQSLLHHRQLEIDNESDLIYSSDYLLQIPNITFFQFEHEYQVLLSIILNPDTDTRAKTELLSNSLKTMIDNSNKKSLDIIHRSFGVFFKEEVLSSIQPQLHLRFIKDSIGSQLDRLTVDSLSHIVVETPVKKFISPLKSLQTHLLKQGRQTLSPPQIGTTTSVQQQGRQTLSPPQIGTTISVQQQGRQTLSPPQIGTTTSVQQQGRQTLPPDEILTNIYPEEYIRQYINKKIAEEHYIQVSNMVIVYERYIISLCILLLFLPKREMMYDETKDNINILQNTSVLPLFISNNIVSYLIYSIFALKYEVNDNFREYRKFIICMFISNYSKILLLNEHFCNYVYLVIPEIIESLLCYSRFIISMRTILESDRVEILARILYNFIYRLSINSINKILLAEYNQKIFSSGEYIITLPNAFSILDKLLELLRNDFTTLIDALRIRSDDIFNTYVLPRIEEIIYNMLIFIPSLVSSAHQINETLNKHFNDFTTQQNLDELFHTIMRKYERTLSQKNRVLTIITTHSDPTPSDIQYVRAYSGQNILPKQLKQSIQDFLNKSVLPVQTPLVKTPPVVVQTPPVVVQTIPMLKKKGSSKEPLEQQPQQQQQQQRALSRFIQNYDRLISDVNFNIKIANELLDRMATFEKPIIDLIMKRLHLYVETDSTIEDCVRTVQNHIKQIVKIRQLYKRLEEEEESFFQILEQIEQRINSFSIYQYICNIIFGDDIQDQHVTELELLKKNVIDKTIEKYYKQKQLIKIPRRRRSSYTTQQTSFINPNTLLLHMLEKNLYKLDKYTPFLEGVIETEHRFRIIQSLDFHYNLIKSGNLDVINGILYSNGIDTLSSEDLDDDFTVYKTAYSMLEILDKSFSRQRLKPFSQLIRRATKQVIIDRSKQEIVGFDIGTRFEIPEWISSKYPTSSFYQTFIRNRTQRRRQLIQTRQDKNGRILDVLQGFIYDGLFFKYKKIMIVDFMNKYKTLLDQFKKGISNPLELTTSRKNSFSQIINVHLIDKFIPDITREDDSYRTFYVVVIQMDHRFCTDRNGHIKIRNALRGVAGEGNNVFCLYVPCVLIEEDGSVRNCYEIEQRENPMDDYVIKILQSWLEQIIEEYKELRRKYGMYTKHRLSIPKVKTNTEDKLRDWVIDTSLHI
jgi:hypothetical protein